MALAYFSIRLLNSGSNVGFLIIREGARRLFSSSSGGLGGSLRFVCHIRKGLLAGCGQILKQPKTFVKSRIFFISALSIQQIL